MQSSRNMKSQTTSSVTCQKNYFYSNKVNVRKSFSNMYGFKKLELYCSQYKKLKNFVSSSRNTTGEQLNMTPHPTYDASRKRKTRISYNLNYLHSFTALILCTIVSYWNPLNINIGVFALSSDSQMPPSISSSSTPNSHSRALTEKLLNLDLGYNVLNSEMLRQGMGFSLESLEEDDNQHFAQSRMDSFNRHDYGTEWGDDFYSEEESADETLPTPQHLSKWI